MTLSELLKMDANSAIDWLIENQEDYELVSLEIECCSRCGSNEYQVENTPVRPSVYCLECNNCVQGENETDAIISWNHQLL